MQCFKCGAQLGAEQTCPNCGMKMPEGAAFCSSCGAKMNEGIYEE